MSEHEEEKREVARVDCFLCDPLDDLIFDSNDSSFAMAGLGPIVDGYSIVSTLEHIDNIMQLSDQALANYLDYMQRVRRELEQIYGSCLVTEHGRMPICTTHNHTASSHCYHPHFLLFPNAPSIVDEARQMLGEPFYTPSPQEAIRSTAQFGQYLLISPKNDEFYVFRPIDNMPRQILRLFVADALDAEERASWRDHPNLVVAAEIAQRHRKAFNR
ncbi:hypothetical protein [Thiohalobacter thiocyanaticus]|uniref:hypothetical protein n=1 Tax=Thiohalobacter thiocyanaticus TaxID=585455 RepID=UPI000F632B00|nr:hypothetical protein [Thiohalobacter thiocyanaticus]